MKVLVVIDMQNDFVTGVLGTEEAKAIVPGIKKYIKDFDGLVLFTRDTHGEDYLQTEEGKKLPVKHCIFKTDGHEIIDELKEFSKEDNIFDKNTFGSEELGSYLQYLDEESEDKIESITLVGVCTEFCVISNAFLLKAFLPNVPINVVESLVRGASDKGHKEALASLATAHVNII